MHTPTTLHLQHISHMPLLCHTCTCSYVPLVQCHKPLHSQTYASVLVICAPYPRHTYATAAYHLYSSVSVCMLVDTASTCLAIWTFTSSASWLLVLPADKASASWLLLPCVIWLYMLHESERSMNDLDACHSSCLPLSYVL